MAPGLKKDYGAGLRLSKDNIEDHPAGPPQREGFSQTERIFQVAGTLFAGILSINASQFIGAPLKFINPEYYDAYMAFTKQSFSVLVNTMTQWWAPTVVRVSGDASMRGQLQQMDDGSLRCNFPNRLVMMANHQLYTDWLYLWWIAYTNGMHGRVHIILKESLKKIPFIGWGCQFYNFIFVARKWETDKAQFEKHLQKLNNNDYPMWLLIFPEGTNLSKVTKEKSAAWAEKQGLEDMKHQLLPRSTGLRFCLENLHTTTPWLYDCTIGYEGIPPGKFGQDIFTLRSSFFEGRPPKSVNMHWRRFRVAEIPMDDPHAFEVWLRNRWREKDYMLEYFARTGRFPTDQNWMLKQTHQMANGDVDRTKTQTKSSNYIETQVKSQSWEEFLMIFAPVSAFVIVLFLFYSASQGTGMPGGNGEAPKEWSEAMNHAAAMFNNITKMSGAQQMQEAAGEAYDKAEEAGNQLMKRPTIRRALSSSSTAVSSDKGAPKYKFVPNAKGIAKSEKAPTVRAQSQPPAKRVIRLADGRVVPLKMDQDDDAKSESALKTSTAPKAPAAGAKYKFTPNERGRTAQKPPSAAPVKATPGKAAPSAKKQNNITTAPGLKVKPPPTQKAEPAEKAAPTKKAAVKPITNAPVPKRPSANRRKSIVSSVATPSKVANRAATVPKIMKKPSTQSLKQPPSQPKKTAQASATPKVVPVKKAAPAAAPKAKPKPAAAPKDASAGKAKQLANGMWVNTATGNEMKPPAAEKGHGARQLANGVWVNG